MQNHLFNAGDFQHFIHEFFRITPKLIASIEINKLAK
jgi:hypothetical protein